MNEHNRREGIIVILPDLSWTFRLGRRHTHVEAAKLLLCYRSILQLKISFNTVLRDLLTTRLRRPGATASNFTNRLHD